MTMTHTQILIHEISYTLPPDTVIFDNVTLVFAQFKTGLVGKNGIGKSTLIKLITGELVPDSGSIQISGYVAYVPQNPIISHDATVAGLLECEVKLKALHRIEQGSMDEEDFQHLNEDWDIEKRMRSELRAFSLDHLAFHHPVTCLSGGELTRLLLTKAFSSHADFLLLDEPTNHLDSHARKLLYDAIKAWQGGLIIVSHDRTLLNLMDEIVELSSAGASHFGGNYDHYKEQKEYLLHAREQQLIDARKFLKQTKQTIQLTKEKHQQRQARGEVLRRQGGQPKILLDAMENRSTASQGSLLIRHNRMLGNAEEKLRIAHESIEINNRISVDLPKTKVANGKLILKIENLTFSYPDCETPLIQRFNLTLQGPARVSLSGSNGSGKTTLIKLILNELQPSHGDIYIGTHQVKYLDQKAEILNPNLTILDNFLRLNDDATVNDAYRYLAQFLFKNITALKLVKHLSGGEQWRALLACTLMSNHPPQLLILDEPTNHLDIDSIESIESALKNYQGALMIISHDQPFLNAIGMERIIHAPFMAV